MRLHAGLVGISLLLSSCAAEQRGPRGLGRAAVTDFEGSADSLAAGLAQNLRYNGPRPLKVAVLDFSTLQGQPCGLGATLAEVLTTRLFQQPSFEIIERRQLQRVLAEQRISATDLVDPETAARLGRVLGAGGIVTGTFAATRERYVVSARVVLVESARVVSVADVRMARNSETEQLGSCGTASGGSTDGAFYSNDFEQRGVRLAEWSDGRTDATPSGRRFLGRFGNGTTTLTLRDLPAHTRATLSFDLFAIQSWDGNSSDNGPDIWEVGIAGSAPLLRTSFCNLSNFRFGAAVLTGRQAYPDAFPGGDHPPMSGAAETNSLGYTFVDAQRMDSVYRLSYQFTHSSDSLALNFSASGLQVLDDESWGLDNVTVRVE